MSDYARALDNPDYHVRLKAIKGAVESRDSSILDHVLRKYASEPHPKVRRAIVYSLGKMGRSLHVPFLAKAAADEDAVVRLQAADSLARIQDSSCYPHLVRCLGMDADSRVRDLAAHHLVQLGRQNLLKLLQKMIRSSQDWEKEAVQACKMFNSPLVVPLLQLAALTEKGNIREQALESLKRLASLGNESAAVVLQQLEDLGGPGQPRETDVLLEIEKGQRTLPEHVDFDKTYTGGEGHMPRVDMNEDPHEGDPAGKNHRQSAKFPNPAPPAHAVSASEGSPLPPSGPTPTGNPQARDPGPDLAQKPPPARPAPDAYAGMGGMVAGPRPPRSSARTRPCPICGEEIAANAIKCRFCNEVFDREKLKEVRSPGTSSSSEMPVALGVISVLTVVLGCLVCVLGLSQMGNPATSAVGKILVLCAAIEIGGGLAVRRGSPGAWTVLVVFAVLRLMSIVSSIGSFLIGLTWLIVLYRADVKAYCGK